MRKAQRSVWLKRRLSLKGDVDVVLTRQPEKVRPIKAEQPHGPQCPKLDLASCQPVYGARGRLRGCEPSGSIFISGRFRYWLVEPEAAASQRVDVSPILPNRSVQQPAKLRLNMARAAYHLKKMRAKNMVARIGHSRRYQATPSGLKTMAALLALRHHVIQPLLASTINLIPSRGAQNPTPLGQCYASLRTHMHDLLQQLGVAA